MPEFREGRLCIPLCKDGSVWLSLPVSGITPHQFAWKSLILVITQRGALLFSALPPPPFLSALRSGELRLVNILLLRSSIAWFYGGESLPHYYCSVAAARGVGACRWLV